MTTLKVILFFFVIGLICSGFDWRFAAFVALFALLAQN